MEFTDSKNRTYALESGLRDKLKPGWKEMLNPAKGRKLQLELLTGNAGVVRIERDLNKYGETLVGKSVLDVGCGYGEKSLIMAKLEGTRVIGMDVNEYTADQSPDLNSWNPKDIEFVHNKLNEVRSELRSKFPKNISDKVSFITCKIEDYMVGHANYNFIPFDMIVSWDVLEHIINLSQAFKQMAHVLKTGGICYHEYNPFFSHNGGHSLCTLDFLYGHCCLNAKDFERYVKEVRPEEEKIDLNFYYKCLNRATMADVKRIAGEKFEILEFEGKPPFGKDTERWKKGLEESVLARVLENYPTATIDDLMCDSVHLILRKK